jgi:hypothetical protein
MVLQMKAPRVEHKAYFMPVVFLAAILLSDARTEAAVLFSDNFNSGASPLWQNQSGAWAANGGVYAATAPNNFPNAYSLLPFNLTNFFVDVDINGVTDGGIWLRSAPVPGGAVGVKGVLLVLKYIGFSGESQIYWHISDGNSYGDAFNLITGAFVPGSNTHVHVEVSGDAYAAFLNGATNPVTTLTTSTVTAGQAGLYDFSSETFDNFVLQTPGTNGATVPSETTPFVEVRWQSSFGIWYQVQISPAKSANSWVNYGDPTPGTGGVMSVMVEASQQSKFVRIQSLP